MYLLLFKSNNSEPRGFADRGKAPRESPAYICRRAREVGELRSEMADRPAGQSTGEQKEGWLKRGVAGEIEKKREAGKVLGSTLPKRRSEAKFNPVRVTAPRRYGNGRAAGPKHRHEILFDCRGSAAARSIDSTQRKHRETPRKTNGSWSG